MLLMHFALPPQQWQLLARLGAASLPPGDYTESWLPAGPFRHLSATAEIIAVKSNCSYWITSILLIPSCQEHHLSCYFRGGKSFL